MLNTPIDAPTPRPIGSTPEIPDWIRGFTLEGYRNVYELLPHETCLYGAEDLYGDWHGDTLILGREHGPVASVTARVEADERTPFGHERGDANTELLKQRVLAGGLNRAIWSRECGLLYGTAAAGLCRAGVRATGVLPKKDEALTYGAQVLSGFVLQQMPNLRQVVCLGREAWRVATRAFEVTGRDRAIPSLKPVSAVVPQGAATRAVHVTLLPLHALGAVANRADVEKRWGWAHEAVAASRAGDGQAATGFRVA